jgi:HEAT repeat protein
MIVGLLLLAPFALGCGQQSLEKRSVADLERMLDDPNPTVQAQAAFGLGQHGPEAATAVPALMKALSSQNALVRQNSCLALGDIGQPAALQATRALVEVTSDPEWAVRRQAVVAIGKIHPPLAEVESAVRKCAGDQNPSVQKAALDTIAALGGVVADWSSPKRKD